MCKRPEEVIRDQTLKNLESHAEEFAFNLESYGNRPMAGPWLHFGTNIQDGLIGEKVEPGG